MVAVPPCSATRQPIYRNPHHPQVYERFLHSDLNASGRGGAFPANGLGGVREHTIQDTHVLQVREREGANNSNTSAP